MILKPQECIRSHRKWVQRKRRDTIKPEVLDETLTHGRLEEEGRQLVKSLSLNRIWEMCQSSARDASLTAGHFKIYI